MNIHEYQAKEILSKFGVSIPKGGIAYSPENAEIEINHFFDEADIIS